MMRTNIRNMIHWVQSKNKTKKINKRQLKNRVYNEKIYQKKYIKQKKKIAILLLLAIFNVSMLSYINDFCTFRRQVNLSTINYDEFRNLNISTKSMNKLKDMEKKYNIEYSKLITLYMLLNHYDLSNLNSNKIFHMNQKYRNIIIKSDVFATLYEKYKAIFDELKYFPIRTQVNGDTTVSYEDSWKSARTYGGKRFHEGCDLMASHNVRGYIPVVSITNGTVEKMGWLDQGGNRIGIRTKSGGYFYYAHLYSYAPELEVGDEVLAGELLGFMGDSGYGKEGTVGKFDVHLHLGIYINNENEEMSVNPYWILKYLENYKLACYY